MFCTWKSALTSLCFFFFCLFAAAKEGSRAWNEVLSAQEKAAKAFMEIEGVGETAAMVLASTTSLGGAPHRSRESLAEWAAKDQGAALKKVRSHTQTQTQTHSVLPPSTPLPMSLSLPFCKNSCLSTKMLVKKSEHAEGERDNLLTVLFQLLWCQFLIESTELPHNLRRWPAWRAKFVPRIIEALVGS